MKYVLVTGAFGGMGIATVKTLSKQGYFVFAMDKNIPNDFSQENVMPIYADVTDQNSLLFAFETVKKQTDELFAIVHFAGYYMLNSLIEIDEKAFVNAFNVNFFGAYRVHKTFFPLLKEGSRIVITTSELAPLAPLPFTGIYAITKSSLDKYAYSLRMEVQLKGIKVSVLRPGAVKTDMLGVSTSALDRFTSTTKFYNYNAVRFKKIVESVEAKNVSTQKIANKTLKILNANHPKHVYNVNRNPLLLLLNVLPKRLQTFIIKLILK